MNKNTNLVTVYLSWKLVISSLSEEIFEFSFLYKLSISFKLNLAKQIF